ncbi:MAG TPA: SusC/RagA family TonB-linked outer membrane protein [Saprospiraceae bacterium]|nr:SusC/RagA family TonB-linked outer membrane protein [Saprospiraceae bacterium]
MKRLSLLLVTVFCAFGLSIAQRTVSGQVADDQGVPLIGANVVVKGTTVGTVTDFDGNYSLTLPDGGTTLVITYTGYSTQELEIGGQSVINITMSEGVELGEVVVTGLGIKREKKALGYAVTTISDADLELRPEADVARVLRGKVPGVDIVASSGLAGSGTNVTIRGLSSISGTNQPLFVVDGVPFGSGTDADRDANSGNAAASSRFLDLDPKNIAEISVLKGLSATVLYGEQGRNGVILITTKTGSDRDVNKKFNISIEQGLYANQIASLPDDQDLYGNGFDNSASAAFSNWGAPFDSPGKYGIGADGAIPHPYDRSALRGIYPEYIGARLPYKAYDNLQEFFETGLISNTSVSLSNRISDGTTINASYAYRDEGGFVPLSNLKRHNFSLGAHTRLANNVRLSATFNYINMDRVAPPAGISTSSNPDGGAASLFSNVFYVPRSIPIFGLIHETPDHKSIFYRGGNDIQHPIWTLENTSDKEFVDRFFGTISVGYDITDGLSLNYRVGIDQYNQRYRYEVNRNGTQIPDGLLETSLRQNFIQDHNLNLAFQTDITQSFDVDALVGVNYRGDNRDETYTNSSNQFVYGLLEHSNFITHENESYIEDEKLVGAYAALTFGFKDFFYLNLQGRNDWTSTLEEENRTIFYPSASIAFVPTDAFDGLQGNVLNYLKFRIGYGTSAGYPDPYSTRNILATVAKEFVSAGGTNINTNSVSDVFGNPNLTPELHKEIEFGVEAKFFDNRIGIDLSLYDKNSTDLIIPLDLDPSTGGTLTTVNAAEVSNRGIELGVNLTPVRSASFVLGLFGNFTKNNNTVDKIIEGVDKLNLLGLYTTLGSFIVPGEPYGVIEGQKIQRHENGGLLVSTSGTYVVDNSLQVLGDPNPNYQLNGGLNMSWKFISVSGLISYSDGGSMYATTPSTLMGRGILQETDFDRFVPVIAPGVQADGSPNTVQINSTSHYWTNGGVFIDEMRIYDASYVKLREVALSFELPAKVLDKSPFGSVSLTLSGQNMWFRALGFPKGANFDPELSGTGVGNARGFELMNVPTSKQFGGSLRFTF